MTTINQNDAVAPVQRDQEGFWISMAVLAPLFAILGFGFLVAFVLV